MNEYNANFSSSIHDVFELYFSIIEEELCPSTIKRYLYALTSFDEYLSSINFSGTDISEDMIINWIDELSTHLSPDSIRVYHMIVRQLLKVGKAYGIKAQFPPNPSNPDFYLPHIYTNEEITMIAKRVDNLTKSNIYPWIHIEYPIIFRILISCGTRITETLELQVKNVDLKEGVFTMKQTKRKKERFVPFDPLLKEMLTIYINSFRISDITDAYLFPGKSLSEPLQYTYFGNKFRRIVNLLGISIPAEKKHARGACVHCLRHTFGCNSFSHLKAVGMTDNDIFSYLSTYLGHNGINETQKYLKFLPEMVSEYSQNFENSIGSIFECPVFTDDSEWED